MKNQEKVRLDHINLTVKNFGTTAKWYSKMFGFKIVEEGITPEGRPWGILRTGDSMLCVYEDSSRIFLGDDHPEAEKVHRIYHFGLRITNRSEWERTLSEERTPTYYGSPILYPHSTSWYIKDPTGHMIEVASWNDDKVSFASD